MTYRSKSNESVTMLFVINDWAYFNLHWRERIEYFSNKNLKVIVAGPDDMFFLAEAQKEQSFEVRKFSLKSFSFNLVDLFRTTNEIRGLIRELKPNFLHTVTYKINLICGIAAAYTHTPILTTFAGLGRLRNKKLHFKFLLRLSGSCFRLVNAINKNHYSFFENHTDRQLFVGNNYTPRHRSFEIPGAGVNLEKFYFKPITKLVLEERIVLFGARLLKSKGLEVLVEACKLIIARGNKVTLVVAGLTREDPENLTPSEIEDMVSAVDGRWLGSVKNMPDLIGKSVVVCLPTQYGEGIPRILLESLSCGRALIAPDGLSFSRICKPGLTGEKCDPTSSTSIADAIERAFCNLDADPEIYSSNCRELAKSEFSFEIVTQKTAEVYQILIDSSAADKIHAANSRRSL